ncbi:MAG: ribonuclease P protein component [Candidatus Saccharimonadales bacterium]
MIGRKNRFHGRASLNYVYKRGQVTRSQYASLKYVTNDRRRDYRLAVVVSRKVSKLAVVRNRIRRRLYEVVRNKAGSINGAYDMVLMVYDAQLATMPAEVVEKTIDQLLKKAGITKKDNKATRPPTTGRAIVKGKDSE